MPTYQPISRRFSSGVVDDRRAVQRFAWDVPAGRALVARLNAPPWIVGVLNASVGGVQVILDEPQRIGRKMTLTLYNTARVFETALPACVVYSKRDEVGGGFLTGFAFTRRLNSAEVAGLLGVNG